VCHGSGIGQQFAQLELKVALAVFLQRLRMDFVAGQRLDAVGFPVQTSIITATPKYPMLVRLRKRASN
jgi:cytochrome P450